MEIINTVNNYILNITNQSNPQEFFETICIPLYMGILTMLTFLIPLSITVINTSRNEYIKNRLMPYIKKEFKISTIVFIIYTSLIYFIPHFLLYKLNYSCLEFLNSLFIFLFIASLISSICLSKISLGFFFNQLHFICNIFDKNFKLKHTGDNQIAKIYSDYFINRYIDSKNKLYDVLYLNDYKLVVKELLKKSFNNKKYTDLMSKYLLDIYKDLALKIKDDYELRNLLYIYSYIIEDNIKILNKEHIRYIIFRCLYFIVYRNYKESDIKLLEASMFCIENTICVRYRNDIITKDKFLTFEMLREALKILMLSVKDNDENKIEVSIRHLKNIKSNLSLDFNSSNNNYKDSYSLDVASKYKDELEKDLSNDDNFDVVFTNYYHDLIFCYIIYLNSENKSYTKLLSSFSILNHLNNISKLWASIFRLNSYLHNDRLSPTEIINDFRLNTRG